MKLLTAPYRNITPRDWYQAAQSNSTDCAERLDAPRIKKSWCYGYVYRNTNKRINYSFFLRSNDDRLYRNNHRDTIVQRNFSPSGWYLLNTKNDWYVPVIVFDRKLTLEDNSRLLTSVVDRTICNLERVKTDKQILAPIIEFISLNAESVLRCLQQNPDRILRLYSGLGKKLWFTAPRIVIFYDLNFDRKDTERNIYLDTTITQSNCPIIRI